MKRKTKSSAPRCVFCGRSGSGVMFVIFNPRFQPFGTACTECEEKLPPGTTVPARDADQTGAQGMEEACGIT